MIILIVFLVVVGVVLSGSFLKMIFGVIVGVGIEIIKIKIIVEIEIEIIKIIL